MTGTDALARGRAAFARGAWEEAYGRISAADEESSLAPDDVDRLATAAYLTGRDDESADLRARAHQAFLDREEVERAARSAFWLAFGLMLKGDRARAGGWLARAGSLLEDHGRPCVERGYLLIPAALRRLGEGDAAGALDDFRRAAEIARRFDDPDLGTLGLLGRGQALLRLGEIEQGVAKLDEAMAAAEAGGLSPIVVGTVYCAVIEACREIFDLRRAKEWTEALSRWCEARPELVPFRGQCLVRRAEIMQLQGAWSEALDEARRACERLAGPPGEPAAGVAFYRRAELHRLRGEVEAAEEAYRAAAARGREPQPGLARLRLAQGRVEDAAAAIRRVVDETRDRARRAHVLPAAVEILLAADDVPAARAAADELTGIAAALDAPYPRALADHARGAVLLAEGDARAALEPLRRARSAWEALDAPYEAARTRLPLARACRALGDGDTAELELEAARAVFRELGATPDLERIDALLRPDRSDGAEGDAHGLTPRELEVLRLVSTGDTNRAIAEELYISERTVERHLSNIFSKLRVSSRTAAAAWAYEHELV